MFKVIKYYHKNLNYFILFIKIFAALNIAFYIYIYYTNLIKFIRGVVKKKSNYEYITNECIHGFRFSQARVFVTSHLHRNEKIQRSCGSAGQQPLEALCYPKCLYNSPLNYEDKTIVLKIASSKVMIEIQPLSIDKLAEEVQKTNRRQSNFTLNQQRVEQSSLNRNTRSNQDMSFNPTMS